MSEGSYLIQVLENIIEHKTEIEEVKRLLKEEKRVEEAERLSRKLRILEGDLAFWEQEREKLGY